MKSRSCPFSLQKGLEFEDLCSLQSRNNSHSLRCLKTLLLKAVEEAEHTKFSGSELDTLV